MDTFRQLPDVFGMKLISTIHLDSEDQIAFYSLMTG